ARPARLRLVMAGAGPVDDTLDESFRTVFGVGIARNYGSTELGCSFAGPPGLAARAIGSPLPGVQFRLMGEAREKNPLEDRPDDSTADVVVTGRLEIRFDGAATLPGVAGGWHDTGDIATQEGNIVRLVGRSGRAIRRGGRWVSPLEVEEVLRRVNGVREVLVKRQDGPQDGEDRILAIVAVGSDGPDEDALRAAAKHELTPHKVPDEFQLRDSLRRSSSGKVLIDQQFRLAPGAMAVARAYKSAELLFALDELGALDPLVKGASAHELAAWLACDQDALEWLLRVATDLGVVSTDPVTSPAADGRELLDFVRLEELLSRTLVTREELAIVARTGVRARGFETRRLGQLPRRYQSAMHGSTAVARTRIGLRLAMPISGAHVVEVTAGPGHYLSAVLECDPSATGELVQLGRLAAEPARSLKLAAEEGRVTFAERLPEGGTDLCVVANGIHGPGPGADLAGLLATLRPGGKLLVDDVFMPGSAPGPGAELGLDWLTHGGMRWPSVDDLTAGFAQLGADVVRRLPLGNSPSLLLLVSQNEGAEKP
ncbi:MAG: AMP-binding protein, partial [Dietzia sp.]|nr:AMP-binding protein [Dietzia sp.]